MNHCFPISCIQFLIEYFGWIFDWMNISNFISNWMLNWIIFGTDSMFDWIIETYRTGLIAPNMVFWLHHHKGLIECKVKESVFWSKLDLSTFFIPEWAFNVEVLADNACNWNWYLTASLQRTDWTWNERNIYFWPRIANILFKDISSRDIQKCVKSFSLKLSKYLILKEVGTNGQCTDVHLKL